MKRYLSFVLFLGLVLTMLGALPVNAEVSADYPYLYKDFEHSSEMGTSASHVSWAEGGVGGSNGSLYVSQTEDVQDYSFNVPSYNFMIGQRAKISAWIKLDTSKTKLNMQSISYVMFGPSEISPEGQSSWLNMELFSSNNLDLNSGEWVYVESYFTWDGVMADKSNYDDSKTSMTPCRICPRVGSYSSGVLDQGLAEDSPTRTISYWIDNLTLEPVVEMPGESIEKTDTNVLFSASFESGLDGVGGADNSYSAEIGPDGKPGILKHAGAAGNYQDCTSGMLPIKYNKLYRVSMKAKADSPESVGVVPRAIFMRQDRLDFTNDPIDQHGDHGSYQYVSFEQELTTEWQTFTAYMKRNVKTFDEKTMSIWFRFGDGTEAQTVSVDDIKVEEFYEIVTNGDFEDLKTDIPATVHWGSNDIPNEDYNRYGTFYGWFEEGVSAEACSDIPLESEGEKSVKITVGEANGSVTQGVFIPYNTEQEISFWAKGEGESVGKSIQLKLDRYVEEKDDDDVYEVLDTELLGTNWVLSEEWQKFTIPYTFAVVKPENAATGVGPRQPYLSFVVDNGTAGMTYYLDDVMIGDPEEENIFQNPYVENVSVTGNALTGDTLTIEYSYQNDAEKEQGTSFVRVWEETDIGDVITGIYAVSDNIFSYTLPENLAGKNLSFEILPMTADGIPGVMEKVSVGVVKRAQVILPSLGEFDEASASITGSLYVENNLPGGETLNLFIVVAVYDENGAAIRMNSSNISVPAEEKDTVTCTVSTVAEEKFAPVDKVKVYVWGGTDVFNTNMISYTDVIEKEK